MPVPARWGTALLHQEGAGLNLRHDLPPGVVPVPELQEHVRRQDAIVNPPV